MYFCTAMAGHCPSTAPFTRCVSSSLPPYACFPGLAFLPPPQPCPETHLKRLSWQGSHPPDYSLTRLLS